VNALRRIRLSKLILSLLPDAMQPAARALRRQLEKEGRLADSIRVIEGAQRLVEAASTPTGDSGRASANPVPAADMVAVAVDTARKQWQTDRDAAGGRVLVDVLVGHILGSENAGQGAPTARVEPRLRTARASHLTPMNRRRQRDVG